MKRIHALLIALALGIAVVAGTFAALRTIQLGSRSAATNVSSTQIARQDRALAKAEAVLRAELRRKPPAIAALPVAQTPGAAATPTRAAAAAQTVIYRRPAPVVRIVHRHGGEHESEAAGGEGQAGLDD